MFCLILALCAQDKSDLAAERVLFPDEETLNGWRAKGAVEKKIIDTLTDRAAWARAFRQVAEKLGLSNPESQVKVSFEDRTEGFGAQGYGKDGRGSVTFNMRVLKGLVKEIDRVESLKKSGAKFKLMLPYTPLEAILAHEITHVFCGAFPEAWLTEGIACYAAGDTSKLYGFAHAAKPVRALDQEIAEPLECEARGSAFFAWLETKGKVHEFVGRLKKGEAPRGAAAAVTGLTWEKLVAEEKAWSFAYLAKYKKAP